MPCGELVGLGQALVVEEVGEATGVPLSDGAHLPGVLAAVELQGDDGGLGLQAGDGVAGDLGTVEAGDGDERGGDGAEAGGAPDPGRQGEQHTDTVDGFRHGVQVHRETMVGGRLPGDLEAGQGRGARVGHPFDAVDPALLVAERGGGHDRRAGRDPDLQTGLGERVVLPRTSSAVMPSSPCVSCRVPPAGPPCVSYRCGRIAGIRSWKVRPLAGVPRAVIAQPGPERCTFAMIWAV